MGTFLLGITDDTEAQSIGRQMLEILSNRVKKENITPSLSSNSVKELHSSLTEPRTSLCFAIIFSTYFFPSSKPGDTKNNALVTQGQNLH